jgi:predicted phage terminase large subunit-like protein
VSAAPHIDAGGFVAIRQRRQGKATLPSFPAWLPIVTPSYTWHWPYLQHVQAQLDRVTTGECKRLMLFLPPRHGKSEMTTVRYPVWRLERDPSLKIIIGAYNQILANKFSRKARRIAEQRIALAHDRAAVEDWETTGGGGVRAVGVSGGITGQGGNLIVIDDPVKSRDEAESLAYRDRVWDWYTDDLYTRLEPGGSIILIMTRWHDDDLAGRILASDTASDWTVVNLPALAEPNDPLDRDEGEPLNPERYDVPALLDIKQTLGSRSFAALYQQTPIPAEGGMFKRSWWKYYTPATLPKMTRIEQYIDSAFKDGVGNDYSVIETWSTDGNGNYYLLDLWRGRVEYPELIKTIHTQHAKWNTAAMPVVIIIEDKASGQSALQTLRKPVAQMDGTVLPALPVVPFPQPGNDQQKALAALSKVARADGVTPLVEGGRVFLPQKAEWLDDYIAELERFPNGVHDDQVDPTSMALARLPRVGVRAY